MWKIKLVIIGLYAAIVATPGDAKTYTVRANDCVRTADAPLVIAGGDVVAVDLNRGRATAQDVLIIYDRQYDGWASQRLFARFALDPESGAPLGATPDDQRLQSILCGAGVEGTQRRR
ncbi:MAG: hypothetical protein AAGJ87_02520 [Pseudomonadota bacterium]